MLLQKLRLKINSIIRSKHLRMNILKKWKTVSPDDGVAIIEFASWKYFIEYVTDEFSGNKDYIFRGQRSRNWPLESSLDRSLMKIQIDDKWLLIEKNVRKQHLERFQLAARGRLSDSPGYGYGDEENEW